MKRARELMQARLVTIWEYTYIFPRIYYLINLDFHIRRQGGRTHICRLKTLQTKKRYKNSTSRCIYTFNEISRQTNIYKLP